MIKRIFFLLLIALYFHSSSAQSIQKVSFDNSDSTDGYYLAVTPQSAMIKGVVVLLTSFLPPEILLTETKLHGVAYTNDLLFITASMKQKLYADEFAIKRINNILSDVIKRYSADTSLFCLIGYDESGNIALRYTELSHQNPGNYPVQPKAVIGIDAPVDLFGLWKWSERQVKKNFWPGAVGDANYYLETMRKENGDIIKNTDRYKQLTPFYKDADTIGNEYHLRNIPVRLYYDTDIEWQLANRRNSFYDTKFPDGSELINRLLLQGNSKAEFISSKKPGIRNNGSRHPTTISIVDEVDCIQWIKTSLDIFDPATWSRPYSLMAPPGWAVEVFTLPPDFASSITFKGIEDIRFAPGWGDSTKTDYWSYAFLWWLEGKPLINAGILQQNLQAYYSGLINRNIISRKIPQDKLVPVTVKVQTIKTVTGDVQTFSGTIAMLDYMALKPILLNAKIHVKNCPNADRQAVFIEISPGQYKDSIWKELEKINTGFSCNVIK